MEGLLVHRQFLWVLFLTAVETAISCSHYCRWFPARFTCVHLFSSQGTYWGTIIAQNSMFCLSFSDGIICQLRVAWAQIALLINDVLRQPAKMLSCEPCTCRRSLHSSTGFDDCFISC